MSTRSSSHIDRLGRSSKSGQISRECRCLQHVEWSEGACDRNKNGVHLVKDKGKVLPKTIENILREKKILSGAYICRACGSKAKELFGSEKEKSTTEPLMEIDDDYEEDYESNVNDINNSLLTIADKVNNLPKQYRDKIVTLPLTSQLPSNITRDIECIISANTKSHTKTSLDGLLHVIGNGIREDILEDIDTIRKVYNDPERLMNIDTVEYIKMRDRNLVSFLLGVAGIDLDNMSEKVSFIFACTIEQIYYLRHQNIVLPYSFMSNLIQFYTSGSKTVPVFNGKLSPSGSYPTVTNWMAERGRKELEVPNGDVETFFDNAGRYFIKSYRVSSSEYKKSRVFTTGIHIVLSSDIDLQKRIDLIPLYWGSELTIIDKHCKMKTFIEDAQEVFSYFRAGFLEKILNFVINEGNEVEDELALIVKKFSRICTNEDCKKIYNNLKYKCDDCKSKVVKYNPEPMKPPSTSTDNTINYKFNIDIENKQNVKQISMAEPIFVNPNSYENIKVILDTLKDSLHIGIEREWSFVGCDGPPYVIASRVIDSDPERYKWVAMSNGLGHLYMNQMKTLFSVCRSVLLEELAKDVLHFQSPNALKYFFKCSDTHKTYQAMEVLLYGTTMEMAHSYVNECESEPSVEGFFNWNPNNTYHMIRQLILNYTLAILLTKLGDRSNNVKVQSAGRYKFMELFYGFNHPIYQEIEYRDLQQKIIMPEDVKKQRDENLTYSQSSIPKKHPGGDFILENKVKREKMLVSKTDDSEKQWKQVSRSLDDIIKISANVNKKLNIHDVDGERNADMSAEILRWRALLRHTNYLLKHNGKSNAYNMCGEPISSDMINLSENVKERMNEYFEIMEKDGIVNRGLLAKLNVMPNEDLDDLLYEGQIDDE